jgi:ElaB/YqjD/DUF883 family membrane-anchored ribosome-binding protein
VATEQVKPVMGDVEGSEGTAQEAASQALEKAQEKAHDMKGQVSANARTQLDTRSTQLGEQVTAVVQALRETGEQLQRDGNEAGGKAARAIADRVEPLGGYLRELDADRFLGDLESFGRRRPWLAAGIGAAAGFVASRFLKASAENRYRATPRPASDGGTR